MLVASDPAISYLIGLLQTDGTHSGDTAGKGRLSLELGVKDEPLLLALRSHIPAHSKVLRRTRTTNFSQGAYETAILHVYNQAVRRWFESAGVPVGRKSGIIGPPDVAVSRPDYVRGLIDGDGSLGITGRGYPFVSVVTDSAILAGFLSDVIFEICGVRRNPRRNARDGVFNIMVTNYSAQRLAEWCYYAGSLAMERKREAAVRIAAWQAPSSRFGVARKAWTPDDDAVLLSAPSLQAAAESLGRTFKSVQIRQIRLMKDVAY